MSSIGEILREARKRKGVSEEAAAKALKIKLQKLSDMEEDRYDSFAAHLYARSFLKHYSEYLGLDSAPLLQRFEEENPPPEPKPIFEGADKAHFHSPVQQHVPRAGPSFSLTSTGKIVLLVSLVIAVVFIVCLWLIIRMERRGISPAGSNGSKPSSHSSSAAVVPFETGTEPTEAAVDTSPILGTNSSPFKVTP